jgi:hypothetical protein
MVVCCSVQVFAVESKKAATFTVEFSPQELGSFSHELQLRVNSNPFEQYRVALTGVTDRMREPPFSVAKVSHCLCSGAVRRSVYYLVGASSRPVILVHCSIPS